MGSPERTEDHATTDSTRELGRVLQSLRARRHLSRADVVSSLVSRFGIKLTERTLVRIEQGAAPRVDVALALVLIYGAEPNSIVEPVLSDLASRASTSSEPRHDAFAWRADVPGDLAARREAHRITEANRATAEIGDGDKAVRVGVYGGVNADVI